MEVSVPSDANELGRTFDLVVYGATGITGKLMCKHIAQHGPPSLRWAVSGRRAEPLQEIVTSLASSPCPPHDFQVGPSSPSPRRGAKAYADEAALEAALTDRIAASTTAPIVANRFRNNNFRKRFMS